MGGTAVAIRADLSSSEDRRHIVDEATRQLGPIDVLVNNAAVTYLYPFTEFPEKQWRRMFEVQVRAPYELTQLVVPGMIERGEGWILNVSSRAAEHPEGPPFPAVHIAPWTAYGMVKAALERFSTALAAELSPYGVAVNALAPWDNVATPGATAHQLVEGFDLESPDLMAEAALLLCRGDPAVLTGRVAYSQQFLAELQPERPAK
jgi:NAD(P)-dependent dehydrogenase (short-subunit alcohol dehydrogenase family)